LDISSVLKRQKWQKVHIAPTRRRSCQIRPRAVSTRGCRKQKRCEPLAIAIASPERSGSAVVFWPQIFKLKFARDWVDQLQIEIKKGSGDSKCEEMLTVGLQDQEV